MLKVVQMKNSDIILATSLSILISISCFGQQGNYQFNNYGNRSMLLSGNVTGSVQDLGLTYYNPSRLTTLQTGGLAISAKAFQMTQVKLSNFLEEDTTVSNKDFNSIPSLAGSTFNLFNSKFAISFINKSSINTNINYRGTPTEADIFQSSPELEQYKLDYSLHNQLDDEWFGLTWAVKVNQQISLGISSFVSVFRHRGLKNLNTTVIETDDNISYFQKTIGFDQKSYGLFLKLGANYELDNINLGLNISIPYIEVIKSGAFRYKELIIDWISPEDTYYEYDLNDLKTTRKEPLSIAIGAGIQLKKYIFHINLEYTAGLKKYNQIDIPPLDIGEDSPFTPKYTDQRKGVLNFGLGIEYHLKEKVKLYTSFSSDVNAIVRDTSDETLNNLNLGDSYFHLGFGWDWELNWSNIVMGATYTGGGNSFVNPLTAENYLQNQEYQPNWKYRRWQFVVGIEIPFIKDKLTEIEDLFK